MEDGECPQCGTCSPVRRNGTHPLPFSGSPVTSISGLLPSSLRPQATACLPSSSGSSGTMPFSSQCFPLGHTKGPTTCPVCWQQPHQEPHHSLRESWYLLCGCCVSWALPSFDPQKLPRQEDCPQTSPFTQEETETQRLDISLGVPSPSLGGAPWKQGLCHILSLLGTTVF